MKLRWLALYLWRDLNVREKLVAEIKCIYHRMTTSLMFPDRQRRRYITAVGCDCSCVNYMEFYCRAGNCKCQGTEVSDIKEDSMVREHVKRILISLPGLCSPTPWSQNSKGWWESGWVGEMWFEGIEKRNWQRRIHCGPSMELLFLSPGTELEVSAAANNL